MAVPQWVEASAEINAQVDEILAKVRPDGPGCALGAVRGGELVLERYQGLANLELGIPLGPASVFDIASTSKQFTAAMALLLADEGLIGLDDDVRSYLPELPSYAEGEITVRMLVHHTSGLRDYLALRLIAGIDDRDWFGMHDVLEHVSAQRGLNFAPGSRHMYCNSGYVLLAIIVSRVTGISFDAACRERIFAPLGMAASHFREDSTLIVPGMVQMYDTDAKGVLRKVQVNDDVVGDGALMTTLRDLALWELNFVNGTVGGADFFARMAEPGTPPGDRERYGFGLHTGAYRGLRTVSHGGNLHGFNGEFLRFPDHDLTVICLANSGTGLDSGAIARRVADLFLESHLDADSLPAASPGAGAAALHAAAPADLAGQYRDAESGMVLQVLQDSDSDALCIAIADRRIPLLHQAGRHFIGQYEDVDIDVTFVPNGDGITEMQLIHEGERILAAVAIPPLGEQGVDVAEYAGDYASEELPGVVRLLVDRQSGELVMHRGRAMPDRLRPSIAGEFATAYGSIRFRRDAAGRVSGFTASMSRAGGIEYRRIG